MFNAVLGRDMTNEKAKWDNIPSLDDLGMDWDYEPENPLGKRELIRIAKNDLHALLGVKNIPIKVVSKDFDEKGTLVDVDQCGLAVSLKSSLIVKQLVKVGFFLGKQKIVTRAVVRNVTEIAGQYRTGMQFIDLKNEYEVALAAIVASKMYKI